MYETDSVDTQVQILTENFLLALDSFAPFEEKLMKRPPSRWITEVIQTEIKKKFIMSHEYKSIQAGDKTYVDVKQRHQNSGF